MSRLLALLIAGGLVAVTSWGAVHKGQATMTQPSDMLSRLQKAVEAHHDLNLTRIDCKLFFQDSATGVCYGSKQETQPLVSGLDKALEMIGFTPGWREDYTVWVAFYEMRDRSKRTFGVSVTPVKGNDDLEAVREIKAFKNFITVTLDKPQATQ